MHQPLWKLSVVVAGNIGNKMNNYEEQNKRRELQIRVGQAINIASQDETKGLTFEEKVDNWFDRINKVQRKFVDKFFPEDREKYEKNFKAKPVLTVSEYENISDGEKDFRQEKKREGFRKGYQARKEINSRKLDDQNLENSNE